MIRRLLLSRHPIATISTALADDEADSHARYLETTIMGIRGISCSSDDHVQAGTRSGCFNLGSAFIAFPTFFSARRRW